MSTMEKRGKNEINLLSQPTWGLSDSNLGYKRTITKLRELACRVDVMKSSHACSCEVHKPSKLNALLARA